MEGYQVNMLVDTDVEFSFCFFQATENEINVRFSFQGKVREGRNGDWINI